MLESVEWSEVFVLFFVIEFFFGDNILVFVEMMGYIIFMSIYFYVVWCCFDFDLKQICVYLMDCDDVVMFLCDDYVVFFFDLFNDECCVVQFCVNFFGVQVDVLISEFYVEDFFYDFIWKLVVCIIEDGWMVEIVVLFVQLCFFRGQGEQIWGVLFYCFWLCNVCYCMVMQKWDCNFICILCQILKVCGFEGFKFGCNFEIVLMFIGFCNEWFELFGQIVDLIDEFDVGFLMCWSLMFNWMFNGVVNLDFFQVEVDVVQFGVNQCFVFFFCE